MEREEGELVRKLTVNESTYGSWGFKSLSSPFEIKANKLKPSF